MTSDDVHSDHAELDDELSDAAALAEALYYRKVMLRTRGLIAVAAAAAVLAGIAIGGIIGNTIDVLALCAVLVGLVFTVRIWQATREAAHYAANLYETDPSNEALAHVPPKIVKRARAITKSRKDTP